MTSRFAFLLCLALTLAGCAGQPDRASTGAWLTPLHRDHPLVGRIWKPGTGRFAAPDELYGALAGADFVLLGEKHDNPDHHRLQAHLVERLATQNRRPVLVYEMLTAAQQPLLDAHLAANPDDAAGIGPAVEWENTGWPAWVDYQPIAEAALAAGMPIMAGGLERGVTRSVARDGAAALGEGRAVALMLDRPVEDAMRGGMQAEIRESHCRQLPEAMVDPMVGVTLAKDAVMAERMIEGLAADDRDVAVLIAGAGHVRSDWAVPFHLERLAAAGRHLTVAFLEVAADESDPAAYAARHGGRLAFDYVWFTPRVDDADPCAVYADQLRKLRERGRQAPTESGD